MKAKITNVQTHIFNGVKTIDIQLALDEESTTQFRFTMDDFYAAWIEIVGHFDIASSEIPEQYQSIAYEFLDEARISYAKLTKDIEAVYHVDVDGNQSVVELVDGDTNKRPRGTGSSMAKALYSAATIAGFETKIMEGKTTLVEWLKLLKYGRQKRSNEILQDEMDEIFAPEKGAW